MATITFDQSGLPSGTVDRSRSDILPDVEVSITLSAGSMHSLVMLWRPPEDTTSVLAGSGTAWTITPEVDTFGTYLFIAVIDGVEVRRTFTTLSPRRCLKVGAANEVAESEASLVLNTATEIAVSDTNEAFPGQGAAGSAFGWWPEHRDLIKTIDEDGLRIDIGRSSGLRHPGDAVISEATPTTFNVTAASRVLVNDFTQPGNPVTHEFSSPAFNGLSPSRARRR